MWLGADAGDRNVSPAQRPPVRWDLRNLWYQSLNFRRKVQPCSKSNLRPSSSTASWDSFSSRRRDRTKISAHDCSDRLRGWHRAKNLTATIIIRGNLRLQELPGQRRFGDNLIIDTRINRYQHPSSSTPFTPPVCPNQRFSRERASLNMGVIPNTVGEDPFSHEVECTFDRFWVEREGDHWIGTIVSTAIIVVGNAIGTPDVTGDSDSRRHLADHHHVDLQVPNDRNSATCRRARFVRWWSSRANSMRAKTRTKSNSSASKTGLRSGCLPKWWQQHQTRSRCGFQWG